MVWYPIHGGLRDPMFDYRFTGSGNARPKIVNGVYVTSVRVLPALKARQNVPQEGSSDLSLGEWSLGPTTPVYYDPFLVPVYVPLTRRRDMLSISSLWNTEDPPIAHYGADRVDTNRVGIALPYRTWVVDS